MASRREQRRKKQEKQIAKAAPKRRKRWSTGRKIGTVVAVLLACGIGAGVVYAASLMSKLNTEDIPVENIEASEEAVVSAEGYTSFVLFGVDSREGDMNASNSDCIMICSLDNSTKEVKILSILRDTFLDIGGDELRKCNAAYATGGPEKAINMLNRNFDLYLTDYVTVDFGALADIIDLMGGLEIDVQENEIKYLNKYQKEVAASANKDIVEVTEPGLQLLNGVQATSYARIRSTSGVDFTRAQRQRTVIRAMVDKVQTMDLLQINDLINEGFKMIKTSFSVTEILGYAADYSKYEIAETCGFPFEVASRTYEDVGSVDIPLTLESNVVELHEYLYGEEDFQPSQTVKDISQMIIDRVGNIEIEAHQTADDGTSLDDIYQRTEQELGLYGDSDEEEEEEEYDDSTYDQEEVPDEGNSEVTITGSTSSSGNISVSAQ